MLAQWAMQAQGECTYRTSPLSLINLRMSMKPEYDIDCEHPGHGTNLAQVGFEQAFPSWEAFIIHTFHALNCFFQCKHALHRHFLLNTKMHSERMTL